MGKKLLEIRGLSIVIKKKGQGSLLVDAVDLEIAPRTICALVGDSGCGKSLIASSVMGILAENLCAKGNVYFKGTDLLTLSERKRNTIRGKQIGIVMQNCAGSLNPLLKNGRQLELVIKEHREKGASSQEIARNVLKQVRLSPPDQIIKAYPHQLSGGMKQRLLTAIGIGSSPELIIMDEPTKGLDLILRNQIADTIHTLHRETGITILLITHDLEMAYKLSDECYVMKKGRIAAHGETRMLFDEAKDETLSGLLAAEKRMTRFFMDSNDGRKNAGV